MNVDICEILLVANRLLKSEKNHKKKLKHNSGLQECEREATQVGVDVEVSEIEAECVA